MGPKTTKTKKKTKKAKKSKIEKRSEEETTLSNAGSAAYWGHKAFQAMRCCTGDGAAVAELGSELLEEGMSAIVENPQMVLDAIDGVINLYGGAKKFRKYSTNFAQFSERLAGQLFKTGNTQDGAAVEQAVSNDSIKCPPSARHRVTHLVIATRLSLMLVSCCVRLTPTSSRVSTHEKLEVNQEGSRFFKLFSEVDLDSSNSISLEEYVIFCEREGISRSNAEKLFYKADVDGNGTISFEEWTKMMMGRVGRDPETFNCAGQHGLKPNVTPVNGLSCDFCSRPIMAGSLSAGCRHCDCDACGDCTQLNLNPTKHKSRSLDCDGSHGLVASIAATQGTCNWCHRTLPAGSVAMGCDECKCNACEDCITANLESFNVSPRTCRGHHVLLITRATSAGYGCDYCGRGIKQGSPVFECSVCAVDVCVSCIWTDHRRVLAASRPFGCSSNHPFRTICRTSYTELDHRCDWCLGESKIGDRMMRCDVCDVDCCSECFAGSSDVIAAQLVGLKPSRSSGGRRPQLPPRRAAGGDVESPPVPPLRPPRMQSMDSSTEASSKADSKTGNKVPKKKKKSRKHDEFAGTPYKFDAVVRVIGSEDPDLDGHLMTVVSYIRDAHESGEDVVILQRKGMVVREPAENVFLVVD